MKKVLQPWGQELLYLLTHLECSFRSVYAMPGAQLVASLTVDPGVSSLIPARSHTIVEIDHGITSMVILLPLIQERLRKYIHKVLVNHLVKFAQKKFGLVN